MIALILVPQVKKMRLKELSGMLNSEPRSVEGGGFTLGVFIFQAQSFSEPSASVTISSSGRSPDRTPSNRNRDATALASGQAPGSTKQPGGVKTFLPVCSQ